MEETKGSSKTFIIVLPVASRPEQMPIVAAAMTQCVNLFGLGIKVVCVTPKGSCWWDNKKKEIESSRKIAQEAGDGQYAGVFLLLDGGGRLPPGLMCWLEFFPGLEKNQSDVTQFLACLFHPSEKQWRIQLSGAKQTQDFLPILYSRVLEFLTHEHNNPDGKVTG